MNKKFMVLLGIIFIPACIGLRKEQTKVVPDKQENPESTAVDIKPTQYAVENNILSKNSLEPVAPLALEESENPFVTAKNKTTNTVENINLEQVESSMWPDKQEDSINYGFQPIFYDFNKKDIKSGQQDKLENNLKIVKSLIDKNYTIVIEGHACNSDGTPQYNLVLSEDRAKNTANYFENNGISKILTVGRGAERRIVPFGNRGQQAPNRRVEIYAYASDNKKIFDRSHLQDYKT